MFNISAPVGWDGTKFISPSRDTYLHHILCWDVPGQDWISVCLHWNRKFDEIPIDDKYSYIQSHYYLKLSVEEAYLLKEALEKHIGNYNGRNNQARSESSR